ncbi:hypothetical protein APED_30185 [Acanthopleuribacter pedis]
MFRIADWLLGSFATNLQLVGRVPAADEAVTSVV